MSRSSPPTVSLSSRLWSSSQTTSLKQNQESNRNAFNYLEGPRFTYEPPGGTLHYSNDTGVAIHCSASGSPKPQIFWIVAGNTSLALQSTQSLILTGSNTDSISLTERLAKKVTNIREPMANGTLLFPPFPGAAYRQEIHSLSYRCVAENSAGIIVSRAVHLRGVVGHAYRVSVYDEFVIRGNTGVLKCQMPSFVAAYVSVISWIKSNGLEIMGFGEKYSVFPTGELHIRKATLSDSYTKYRCKTRHRLNNETKISDSQGALVLSEPSNSVPPRITDSRSILVVQETTDFVEVPCAAEGWPIPQYKWYKVDLTSDVPTFLNTLSNLENRIDQKVGSLTIRNVRAEDSGKYICIAANNVGEASTETVVRVVRKLEAVIEPPTLIADANQRAVINCSIFGYPRDEVLWLFNGRLLTSENERRLIQHLGSQSILVISEVSSVDIGMYQCLVTNDIGDSAQASSQLLLGDVAPYFVETFSEQTAKVGDKVSLKCIAGGSPLPMITWTLDGMPFEDRKHTSEGSALRRAMWGDFVVFGKGQVVSHINISVESVYDGGHYECVASNVAATIRHSSEMIVSGETRIREMHNRSAVATQSISMSCYTVGTKPSLIVWKKDGETLPFNHRQRIHKNGSLDISNLDKAIDSGKYTCVAFSQSDAKNFVQQSMTLTVKVAPIIEDFKFGNRLQAGMRTRVSCNVAQGDQPVQIIWFKDGKNITSTALRGLTVNKADQFSVAIIIENLSSYHNGNYTCVASNEAASVSHTSQLLVNVPPIWVIEPKSASVVEGNAVTIDCVADGYPVPQIIWKHLLASNANVHFSGSQQYQMIRSGPHYQVYENGTLRVSKVRIMDRGVYLCQATNGIGSGLSSAVQLTVNVAVRFENSQTVENVSVVKASSVAMVCKVIGDQPITMQWKRNSHIVALSSDRRYVLNEQSTENGLVSTLNITSAARIDSAVFQCIATNAFGMDTKNIFVIVTEAPEAPLNVRVDSKSSRSVALKWEQAFNGNSRVTSVIVSLKKKKVGNKEDDEYSNITVTGNQTNAIIRNLHPSTEYSVLLYAVNAIGTSKESVEIRFCTEDEAPEAPPTNIRATAINATSIKIDWYAPRSELINGELKGYYIGYKVYNSSDHFLYKTMATNASNVTSMHSMLLHALRPFTNYVLMLQAFNSIGAGPRSDELVIRTHESSPSLPPTKIKCNALSSTSVKVTWDKLAHRNVNGILVGYKVRYKLVTDASEEQIKTEVIRDHNGLILYGLEKFTNYSLKIAAYTAAGDGPFSDYVYCITDEDTPSAPLKIKAAVDSLESIIVTWRAPLRANGILKSYTIYRETDGKVFPFTVPKHLLYHRATGLSEHRKHSFWVKASTSIGEGTASDIVSVTISNTAEARIVSFGDIIKKRVTETTEFPCKAVGIPTPTVEWYFNAIAVSKTTSAVETNIEQLPNGSLRIVKLTKANEGNYSCHSSNAHGKDLVTFTLLVDINSVESESPIIELLDVSNCSVTFGWKNRIRDETVIAQELYYKPSQLESEWRQTMIAQNRNQTYTLQKLSCGTQYQMYLISVTQKGKSASSDVLLVRTQGREPLASPASVFVSKINATSVRLNVNTWRDGGCELLEKSVKWRRNHSPHWNTMNIDTANEPYVINGLKSDSVYKVRVMMRNSAGHTIVEYEVQSSPFKIANVHRSPSDSPEHISSTHRSEDDESSIAPLIFTITLIFLLTATTVLAILLLHRAMQKRALFNNLNDSRRSNQSSCKKTVSHQSTNSEMMSATGSSELSVLNSTIDRANKNKLNTHKIATTTLQNADSNAYQYLTIRKNSLQTSSLQQKDVYSVIQKRDNNTLAKQALCIDLSDEANARYSTPKVASFSQATTPKEHLQQHFQTDTANAHKE
ncbi:Down syndrome cell adhesion molecule-like protein Dscam2, partial [Leptotrombidium deliense]